jgi:hypothetical protein
MTKYAIDHQEAAGTVLIGTAMPVVSVIVNNKNTGKQHLNSN